MKYQKLDLLAFDLEAAHAKPGLERPGSTRPSAKHRDAWLARRKTDREDSRGMRLRTSAPRPEPAHPAASRRQLVPTRRKLCLARAEGNPV